MKQATWPVRSAVPLSILAVMAVTGSLLALRSPAVSLPILASRETSPSDHSAGEPAMSFALSTKSFAPGGEIPRKYTCEGENVSPELSWSEPPQATRNFALIADDPDAPSGTFTHWIVYGLSAGTRQLAESANQNALPGNARQGRNDFGQTGYGGPCPPPGKPHRYFFKLFALDLKLDLKPGASRQQLEQAMKGHVLAQGELMGTFRR